MKELTKAEEQVMQILWEMEGGYVKDIVEHFPDPKPAYNTVSTIIRILETKGFVVHESVGKSHFYMAKISREKYSRFALKKMMNGYFDGSLANLVSFFVKSEKISVNDLEELLELIEKNKNEEK